ncbi:hypothetical protein CLV35_1674 [Motilibacter peucedani]|uniref:FAR-17a/AIG1-like protein n=1 Tax=Motilibacter peucedani TaxID=598650 RepID=A0A420XPP1_9ACTN|nr:Pr6Pr family membrane protein [Motilibacter peucedani]RKS75215.1 hypothetical protein CLV35_1674 [Motilibacter peucedani]
MRAPLRTRRDLARAWHAATAAVCAVALAVQVGLVVSGASVLVTDGPVPGTGTRLWRFFGYFTVQSNLLVLVTVASLALDPARDGRLWRVTRLDAVVGITVTGVVHFFFLRPLLHLHGWSAVTDKLLHVVVPLMAVAGWLALGPRGRTDGRTVAGAMAWPLAYVVYTGVYGASAHWYPYPFADVDRHGYARVAVNGLGVLALLLALSLAARALDGQALDGQGLDAPRSGGAQGTTAPEEA